MLLIVGHGQLKGVFYLAVIFKSYISNIFLQEGVGGIYADKREENELNYVIPSVITNKQS